MGLEENKLVSVITPVFNCSKYIRQSIQSILDQTYKNFEFIILDDGCTDKTCHMVSDFSDKRIKLIGSNVNMGVPFRRNQGVKTARGKYILIHDGDDISLVNRIELQVNYLNQISDVFCVGGYAIKIDVNENVVGKMEYPPLKHDDIVKKIKHGPLNPMIDPTVMFRKKDFIELGLYSLDKKVRLVQDLDLWTRAILSGKILANIPIPLIKYRTNPDGITEKNKLAMIRSHVGVVSRFIRETIRIKELKLKEG
ncbi:MAG: glycosyltransferase [Candidatus Lokiarchaeota archaeon]|nr:glycosyltransferase [Candidatus Lokiarchaeota archaeon]